MIALQGAAVARAGRDLERACHGGRRGWSSPRELGVGRAKLAPAAIAPAPDVAGRPGGEALDHLHDPVVLDDLDAHDLASRLPGISAQTSSEVKERTGAMMRTRVSRMLYITVWALLRATEELLLV